MWVIGIIVTESGWRNWENTTWLAVLLSFCGYAILVGGNLTYLNIITWKWLNKKQTDEMDSK